MMSQDLMNILLSVLPMLLLVSAWFFFMHQMRKNAGGGFFHLHRRQVEALERIAAALEKRS